VVAFIAETLAMIRSRANQPGHGRARLGNDTVISPE
jgi:hypothetical protein